MKTTFNLIKENQISNFEHFTKKLNYGMVNSFVEILLKYKNKNIYTLGIGKSSSLSSYYSDIFKSLNLKSFSLNSNNLTHGDLGCVTNDELIIIISKSGNTEEINRLLKQSIPGYKVLITCNEKSTLSNKVNLTCFIPLEREGDLFFDIIPSNSSTNFLMYLNFVVNLYIEKSNFNFENYKLAHPSGDIGFKTKKIREFVNRDITICKNFNLSNDEIINLLLSSKNGLVFEKDNTFYGILTTKDILKYYVKENKFDLSIYELINKNPIKINNPDELMINKLDLVNKFRLFKFIPVVEKNGKCVGILDNSLLLDLNI